jgi:hypothetical protein
MSAGESGRVGIFVIDPDLHPQVLGRQDSMAAEGEPFIGEIRGDQTRAGMDENATDPFVLKIPELLFYLGCGDTVVPYP